MPRGRQDLLCWKAGSHEPCGSSSNASDSSRQPSDASSAHERVLLNEKTSDAVPSTKCVRKGWGEQQVAERVDTTRRDLRNACTSGRVCDRDGLQSEHDALFFSYLGELEKQCIEFCHEVEIDGLNEALSILSGRDSLFDQMSSKKLLHRHSPALDHHRIPALMDLSHHLR